MQIPLVDNIVEKIKGGGSTGLNQTRNSFKMAGYLLAPFIVGWFVAKTILPPHLQDLASLAVLLFWVVGIVLFYSNAKARATNFIPFPQSHWFFPDGQQVSYDLMVLPSGWEQIKEYKNGTKLYRVFFKTSLAYQETDRPYPDVFDQALWKLPTNWNDTFQRNAEGEFFFDSLFITHPSCENIQVSVLKWDERGSYRLPVCVVTGCSYWGKVVIKNNGNLKAEADKKTMTEPEINEAINLELKAKTMELVNRNTYLEKEHEEYVNNAPRNIKKLSDDRLEAVIKRDTLIRYAKKSLRDRILNMKTFAYAIVLSAILLLTSHFILGYP